MSCCRSAVVTGPIWLRGGQMRARSTTVGCPFSSSSETSASPTASEVSTASVSSFEFARKVSAATFTAF